MSEFRKDVVTGQWVIIASARELRPSDFKVSIEKNKNNQCPFCSGFEYLTPDPLLILRDKKKDSWQVRVVPNKFPALDRSGSNELIHNGVYDFMAGFGTHEVIIETPLHHHRMVDFDPGHIEKVIIAYRSRLRELHKEKAYKYILIFKNHGREAGSSLAHSHSQMIATPILPVNIKNKLSGSKRYFETHHQCAYCHIIEFESKKSIRIIAQNKQFIAIAPYASRVPYEVSIIPKNHQASFSKIDESQVHSLARILKSVLKSYDNGINYPPFNMILHTSPQGENCELYYHWHIEIMPKMSTLAGFELGSGFFINTTPPEEAARHLRQQIMN